MIWRRVCGLFLFIDRESLFVLDNNSIDHVVDLEDSHVHLGDRPADGLAHTPVPDAILFAPGMLPEAPGTPVALLYALLDLEDAEGLVLEVRQLLQVLDLLLAAERHGVGPRAPRHGVEVSLAVDPVVQPLYLVEPGLVEEGKVEAQVVALLGVVEEREHARAQVAQDVLEEGRVRVDKVDAIVGRREVHEAGEDAALGDGGLGGEEGLLANLELNALRAVGAGGHVSAAILLETYLAAKITGV